MISGCIYISIILLPFQIQESSYITVTASLFDIPKMIILEIFGSQNNIIQTGKHILEK